MNSLQDRFSFELSLQYSECHTEQEKASALVSVNEKLIIGIAKEYNDHIRINL